MQSMDMRSFQDSRRLFGAALQLPPEKVANTFITDSIFPDDVANETREVVRQHIKNRPKDNQNIVDDNLSLIFAGMRDTYSILSTSLSQASIADKQKALEIAQHDTTARTLASLALRPEDQLTALVKRQARGMSQVFGVDETENYIELRTPLAHYEGPGSCPFAGHDKIVNPDPIFLRFAKWAGHISVARYYRD